MKSKKSYQLTKEGLEELKKELKERATVTRKRLQDELDDEIREGDISENTSYYRVQEEIGSNQKRIEEIEDILRNAEMIDSPKAGSTKSVGIGTSVTINVKGREIIYQVVGSTEADPTENKVSIDSPLGKALVGKKVGDAATVKTPLGDQKYDIIAIS